MLVRKNSWSEYLFLWSQLTRTELLVKHIFLLQPPSVTVSCTYSLLSLPLRRFNIPYLMMTMIYSPRLQCVVKYLLGIFLSVIIVYCCCCRCYCWCCWYCCCCYCSFFWKWYDLRSSLISQKIRMKSWISNILKKEMDLLFEKFFQM